MPNLVKGHDKDFLNKNFLNKEEKLRNTDIKIIENN